MRGAKRARVRSSRFSFCRSAAATGLVASLCLLSCVSISAFIGPPQLSGGQQQQQQQQKQQKQLQQQPHHSSHRGTPPSFVSSSASTRSEPVWAFDRSRLLLLSGTSAVADVNSTSIKSAMFARPDGPAPLQQQQVVDLPQSPKQRQKAFSSTVVGFVKAGDGESALQLYGKAGEVGCVISENVFNALLSVCEGDKVSQGMGVLADMIAAGIKPRENHYAFLLREAAGRGAFEEAFSQVREMAEGGVQPRLRTYSPLLKGLCNKPDMALAMEVWSHMEAQGVQPTPEEHVDMIKGWAAAGELRRRVADGSVEAFLGRLGDMAFELGPSRESAAAAASNGEASGAGGEEEEEEECGSRSGSAGFLETLLAAFNSDSSSRDGDVQAYYSSSAVPIAGVSSAAAAKVEAEL